MPDEPIRLFSSRAERFPQPDAGDATRTVIEKSIEAAVPVFGVASVAIFTRFLAPTLEKRREEWFKELADAIDDLSKRVDGLTPEAIANNEAFVSAVVQATTAAVGTHLTEKRVLLRNALLNIVAGKAPQDELQQIFLNAVDSLSPLSVRVLEVLWKGNIQLIQRNMWHPSTNPYSIQNYGRAISFLIPELEQQDALLQLLITELHNRGFTTLVRPSDVFPQTAITNIGVQFLMFLADPRESTTENGAR